MSRDDQGRRTVTAKTAAISTASAAVAVLVGALAVLSFFGWTPSGIREREARILSIESAIQQMPGRVEIESLARQLVKSDGRSDLLVEKIDALTKRLDRLEDRR